MTSWKAQALAGAKEEQAQSAAQRRQDRIANCNKPFYWYNPLTKQVQCSLPTCKDWTCGHCNQVRAGEEEARLERALQEHSAVFAIFDISDRQWPKFAQLFGKLNITKDMYRRLPQDNCKVTVFFVGNSREVSKLAVVTPIIKGRSDLDITGDESENPWYDLARKRQGKRTSGNLGQKTEPELDDPELTSVKITTIRGRGVSVDHRIDAQSNASQAIEDAEPHSQEDVEDLVKAWADAYESSLRKLGYHTYKMMVWRKMDLTTIQLDKGRIDVKSLSAWHSQALAGVKEEFAYAD